MPNLKIPTEDQRKLHAEINQIVNQRFLLTTLAVTLFGAVAAWGIPKDASEAGIRFGLPYTSALLLFVVLALIFVVSQNLRRYLRRLSTYLEVSQSSLWEKHCSMFREKYPYFAYTKSQTVFFAVLGLLVLGYPFMIERQLTSALSWRYEPCVLLMVFIIYEVLVLVTGFMSGARAEEKYREQWRAIFDLKKE